MSHAWGVFATGVNYAGVTDARQSHFMQPFSAWTRMSGATLELVERQLKP